eukprot:5715424-Prymnesium_polylepis.1
MSQSLTTIKFVTLVPHSFLAAGAPSINDAVIGTRGVCRVWLPVGGSVGSYLDTSKKEEYIDRGTASRGLGTRLETVGMRAVRNRLRIAEESCRDGHADKLSAREGAHVRCCTA